MTEYFYDSYAIIEFLNGSPVYRPFFLEHDGVTTLYNVMEVCYIVLRDQGKEKAKKALDLLSSLVIHPTLDDAALAVTFRFANKEKRFSYADCLGYILARRLGRRFLTGDFAGLPNVELVR